MCRVFAHLHSAILSSAVVVVPLLCISAVFSFCIGVIPIPLLVFYVLAAFFACCALFFRFEKFCVVGGVACWLLARRDLS